MYDVVGDVTNKDEIIEVLKEHIHKDGKNFTEYLDSNDFNWESIMMIEEVPI